jgi:[ribosomal protein S5]-alanine N-acetyltransferase
LNRPPESFSTERLFCRRTSLDDAAAIFAAYGADPEVTRYLSWKPHASVASVAAFLNVQIDGWEKGGGFRYEICLKGADSPVGSIVLRPEGHKVCFGYVLAKQYWGRGLMAEALKFLVDWSLAQPGVHRAYAYCDVENSSSARVMEKVGMTREGILRRWLVHPNVGPEPRDCFVLAKVK